MNKLATDPSEHEMPDDILRRAIAAVEHGARSRPGRLPS